MWLYLSLAAVIPLIALVLQSLTPYPGAPLSRAGIGNYVEVLQDGLVQASFRNTILLAALASAIAVLLGVAVAREDVRGRSWIGRAASLVASMPLAIPGVVMGLAFFLFGLQTPLYGTLALLLLLFVTKYLPYALNIARNGLLQVGPELEEAASICGAGRWETTGRILVPLIGPSLSAGLVFVMILATQEVASSIFVATTSQSTTLPVMTWAYMYAGRTVQASALGVLQMLLLGVLVIVARFVARGRLEDNFG
jgi:iron(III) transport system permease protein